MIFKSEAELIIDNDSPAAIWIPDSQKCQMVAERLPDAQESKTRVCHFVSPPD